MRLHTVDTPADVALVAGGIVGFFMFEIAERRRIAMTPVLGACVALGVVLAIACVAIASSASPA